MMTIAGGIILGVLGLIFLPFILGIIVWLILPLIGAAIGLALALGWGLDLPGPIILTIGGFALGVWLNKVISEA